MAPSIADITTGRAILFASLGRPGIVDGARAWLENAGRDPPDFTASLVEPRSGDLFIYAKDLLVEAMAPQPGHQND